MRRGSLEYWPHRRAQRQMPRVRSWPSIAEQLPEGIVGVKVGMTHVAMIDNSEGPSKGSEIVRGATVVEIPKIYFYGIRLYDKGYAGYRKTSKDIYAKQQIGSLHFKESKNAVESISNIKEELPKYSDLTALMFADLSTLHTGNKKIMRFEVGIGGKSIEEKFATAEKFFGKQVKVSDLFKGGELVDVTAITKGRGWAGVIKRYGVARLARKATNKIRHVGTLGPWHPPKVLYTVPQAGHMGYNYRTETNKRILKIGSESESSAINVKGGFTNYGEVHADYIIVEGSLPGVAKRIVRIRKALRSRAQPKDVQLTYVSLKSKG